MARLCRMRLSCYSIFVIAFALLSVEISARSKSRKKAKLQYTDCGGENKIIHFSHFQAAPSPLIMPGILYVSMSGNVTHDLPNKVNIYVTIKKYFLNFPVRIPCFSDGIGSCSYENICASLQRFEETGCPLALRYQGIPCTCPFLAGEFSVSDVAVNLPRIEGFASSLLNGKYELQMVVQEEDGPQLGCLKVNFSIRKRRRKRL